MTTLRDLYQQYHANYGSVPRLAHPNSCPVCLGVRAASYPRCAGCQRSNLEQHAGSGQNGTLVSLSTAFEEGAARGVGVDQLVEWYRMLRGYKRTDAGFEAYHEALVALIGVGLHHQLDRIEELLGGSADRACVVPSSKDEYRTTDGACDQPLYRAVRRIRLPGLLRLSALLVHGGIKRRHSVDASTFTCIDDSVHGSRVVLIEDSIVTGASALSARACLLAAGAESVVIVAAARIVQPTFVQSERIDAAAYIDAARMPHDAARWVRE